MVLMLYNGNNRTVLHQLFTPSGGEVIRLKFVILLAVFVGLFIMLQPCTHSVGEIIFLEFVVML